MARGTGNKKGTFETRNGLPPSVRRIKARTKRITTINDIFTRDEINQILDDLNKEKSNIKHLTVIYTTQDGTICSRNSPDSMMSDIIYQIEVTKKLLLNDEE